MGERKLSEIRLEGWIHTGFHHFTEVGQKNGIRDFGELKLKKFPGEHVPGPP